MKRLDRVRSKIVSLCSKSGSEKEDDDDDYEEQKKVNKQINDRLQRDKQEYRSTHRLVLLGPANSGKTTVMSHLYLYSLHGSGVSDRVKQQKIFDVRRSIRDMMVRIAITMKNHDPPLELECGENEEHVEYILKESVKFEKEDDFTDDFYDKVDILWKDNGIRNCFDQIEMFYCMGHLKYFVGKIQSIRDKNYLPTHQDLMKCLCSIKGMREIHFNIERVKFHIIHPRGRDERRKWIQCFNEVTAIIFVVASSSYDMVLREDPSQNCLKEALDLFKNIWNNRWLRTISVILFLNKQDLLEEKVIAGKSRLQDYFPEFEFYRIPQDAKNLDGSEDPEVTRAKYFIRDEFLRLSQFGEGRHYCYPHFTCAVDYVNIHRVFEDCRDIIQRMHLRQYELL